MKTSTKIFVVYGIIIIAIQLVFLVNSLVQYHHLRPLGAEMCAALDKTPIHHIEIDVSAVRYCPDERRWDGREEGPQIRKDTGNRASFYLGGNLETSRISNDTLYVKALNDDLSWRPNVVPELSSSAIITTGGVVEKSY